MLSDMKRIGLEACILITLAAMCGLTLNHQLVMDAFSGHLAPPQSLPTEGIAGEVLPVPVLIEEVQQLMAVGALAADARSPELYAMGHIQNAVSLPLADFDALLPAFLDRVDKGRDIITYCSGFGCPDSYDLAVLLIEAGYHNVRVFEGGFPEWRDTGLPVAGEGK
jgi:rhodanese-related sulfurtransferase